MDEIAHYNRDRWDKLADANALFTRPALDLDANSALSKVDDEGLFGEIAGQRVLCLASGGGQQSAAFALLGADVTVLDLSPAQLERDKQAADSYGLKIQMIEGDMRDLSALDPSSFDLVYQPYSISFVPDARAVFQEVSKVLRPGGIYFFAIGNPFFAGATERDWDPNSKGYLLKTPYLDGTKLDSHDPEWVFEKSESAANLLIPEGREYRQTLSKLLNSLIELNFSLFHFSDSQHMHPDPTAEPGTWDHFVSFAPVFLSFWLRYVPA